MEDTYTKPRADFRKLIPDPSSWNVVQNALPTVPATVYHEDYKREVLLDPTGKPEAIGPIPAIWGYLIWEALRRLHVRTNGLRKLVKYFQQAISYERFLYGTGDDYYRTHNPRHVFAVFLHGLGLLSKPPFAEHLNLLNRDLSDFYGKEQSHTQHTLPKTNAFKLSADRTNHRQQIFHSDEAKALTAIWTIAALCHDLGVPLQKTNKLNEHVRTMFNTYGGISLDDLFYQSNYPQNQLFDSLLHGISHVISRVDNGIGPKPLAIFRTQQVLLAKRKIALIEGDHGISSALLVWKALDGISDVLVAPHGEHTLDAKTSRRFILVREALAAIADHSNEHLYLRHCNLAFLLRICDEASEQNRPKALTLLEGILTPGSSALALLTQESIDFNGPSRTLTFNYQLVTPSPATTLTLIKDQLRKRHKLMAILGHVDRYKSKNIKTQRWVLKETLTPALTFQLPPGSKKSFPCTKVPGGAPNTFLWIWEDLEFDLEIHS
jgi:hypothetical protein